MNIIMQHLKVGCLRQNVMKNFSLSLSLSLTYRKLKNENFNLESLKIETLIKKILKIQTK
jgi:hypothetical protein